MQRGGGDLPLLSPCLALPFPSFTPPLLSPAASRRKRSAAASCQVVLKMYSVFVDNNLESKLRVLSSRPRHVLYQLPPRVNDTGYNLRAAAKLSSPYPAFNMIRIQEELFIQNIYGCLLGGVYALYIVVYVGLHALCFSVAVCIPMLWAAFVILE